MNNLNPTTKYIENQEFTTILNIMYSLSLLLVILKGIETVIQRVEMLLLIYSICEERTNDLRAS